MASPASGARARGRSALLGWSSISQSAPGATGATGPRLGLGVPTAAMAISQLRRLPRRVFNSQLLRGAADLPPGPPPDGSSQVSGATGSHTRQPALGRPCVGLWQAQTAVVDGNRKLDSSGNRKLNSLGVGAYPRAGVGLGGAVGNWLGAATAHESGGDKPVIHSGRAARLLLGPVTTTRPSCDADPSRTAAGSDDPASCSCSPGC